LKSEFYRWFDTHYSKATWNLIENGVTLTINNKYTQQDCSFYFESITYWLLKSQVDRVKGKSYKNCYFMIYLEYLDDDKEDWIYDEYWEKNQDELN